MNYQLIFTVLLGGGNFIGMIFAVYLYFRNPQIKTEQITLGLDQKFENLQKQVTELRETHLKSVENDLKILTTSVNELSKTVVKLATIIDERIPRSNQ